ncbi:MAG: hypothetical protein KMY53_16010 [Desulfarculus sp.]|nr:hypothetical protein [Pseudomonadota bacterium]MBU4599252.1 hypothetical protein [Pseudomonadota bacterium]MBV1715480.1 hypothetical protein [Desulfarculus sp.]MBV1739673.1 hypothetical protein [Desulfarculus sp.]
MARDIRQDYTINRDDMTGEQMEMPGATYYWAWHLGEARGDVLAAKDALEQTKARVALEIKNRMVAQGRKATVNDIDAMVATNEMVITAQAALVEAERNKGRMDAALKAVGNKTDMLINMGADTRAAINRRVS